MGVYLDTVYCKKCKKKLNLAENVMAYDDHFFLCFNCLSENKRKSKMRIFRVLEVDTVIRAYDVIATSEQGAIEKINAAFADPDHPDISRVPEYDNVVDRTYECEGEIR